MIFLLEYDRRRGKIVTLRRFRDANGAAAMRARLDLEFRRHKTGTASEIVLLEAESEDALPARGGILTPASCMGMKLIERLRAAGMTFRVE